MLAMKYVKLVCLESIGAKVIFEHLPPIYYNLSSYSDVFIYFCKKICKRSIYCGEEDISTIIEIYETWIQNEKIISQTTYEKFIDNTEGILRLYISKTIIEHKPKILVDGTENSIISGIYISPFAESIFTENGAITDGVLMDTTWHVLPNFVTSILMLSICNVGIPVAFCFGKAEKLELYDMFFSFFKESLNIDLSVYTIESDNGTALSAVCSKYKCKSLKCLRHFLVSLGTKPYSMQIGELVASKCQHDFDVLCSAFKKTFESYIGTEEFEDIQKTLKKAGLQFDLEAKEIKIVDKEIWSSISQIERIKFRMPSTTNALEASHGHLNEKLPRRNDFWTGMLRLVNFLIIKENNFKKAIKCNFRRSLKNVVDTAKANSFIMHEQRKDYHTDHEKCDCGETKLLSQMI